MSAEYLSVNTVKAQLEKLKLNFPEVSDDPELLADMAEGETELHGLITSLVRKDREAGAFSQAIKAQEEALAERRARFTRRQQAVRQFMHSLLDAAGTNKLVLPEATLSVVNGKIGCVITDETLLPDEYVKVERIPKKQEITKALAAGKDIAGASLKNGNPHLTIRT